MINKRAFILKKNGEPHCRCFCRHPELIENYEKAMADNTQTWDCHHRMEKYFPQKTLIAIGWYYDVEPEELIFLTPTEHNKVDSKCRRSGEAQKGKKLSEEHKMKIGKALAKNVLCVETGEVFESAHDAQRKTGVYQSNISMACNGKLKSAGGFHWKWHKDN